jgi:hypothetical protein
MSHPPDLLYLNWKDPASRRWFVVGRLTRVEDGTSPGYEFQYVAGVQDALNSGFQLFPVFPRIDEVFRSRELLPFFRNRLMRSSRPDYRSYLSQLGLKPGAEEFSELARSGGRRATEGSEMELFAPPQVLEDGRLETHFFVRALSRIAHALEVAATLKNGVCLRCALDLQNPYNRKAVLLVTDDNSTIGFVPDYLCDDVSALLARPTQVEVRVAQVNEPHVPAQNRVLCRLTAFAPPGFHPLSSPMFRPIAVKDKPIAALG